MRVPADPKRPGSILVSSEVVPVDSAAVFTLGPDWEGWRGVLVNYRPFVEGDFVRLRPPPGVPEKHARDVRDYLRQRGASVVLEMPAQSVPVVEGVVAGERPHLRSREVVRSVVLEGESPRKAELLALVEEIMDQVEHGGGR